jgi:hypothetical protein
MQRCIADKVIGSHEGTSRVALTFKVPNAIDDTAHDGVYRR